MSEATRKAIILVPKVTGGLSMLGSSIICWDIIQDRQKKLEKVYYRLLLVMSFMDFFLSFSFFLSTWPIPEDTEDAPWMASGSDAFCTFQGFIMHFFMPSVFYNAYLSIYFVLMIVYGWPERRIVPFEKAAHAFTITFCVVTSFTALGLDMFESNFLVWCFIAGWERQIAFNIAWQWASFCIVLVCMVFLCWKTREQFLTREKYGEAAALRASVNIEENNRSDMSWYISPARNSVRSTGRASTNSTATSNPVSMIMTQAALYCLSFLLTESSNVLVCIFYYLQPVGSVPLWVLVYGVTTLPLQGFWNCVIYFRPQYLAHQEEKRRQGQARSTDMSNTSKGGGDATPSSDMAGQANNPSLSRVEEVEAGAENKAFASLNGEMKVEDVEDIVAEA